MSVDLIVHVCVFELTSCMCLLCWNVNVVCACFLECLCVFCVDYSCVCLLVIHTRPTVYVCVCWFDCSCICLCMTYIHEDGYLDDYLFMFLLGILFMCISWFDCP